MADEIDVANDVILRAAEERTAQISASLQGDGQEECEDCGSDLTPERRAAAPWAIRCVPCADVFEQKAGGYRRG